MTKKLICEDCNNNLPYRENKHVYKCPDCEGPLQKESKTKEDSDGEEPASTILSDDCRFCGNELTLRGAEASSSARKNYSGTYVQNKPVFFRLTSICKDCEYTEEIEVKIWDDERAEKICKEIQKRMNGSSG